MRKGLSEKAKYIIEITSNKATHDIRIKSIFCKKENRMLSIPEMNGFGFWGYTYSDQKGKDGNIYLTSLDNLKEDLNWLLNGDIQKYQFEWGQSGKRDVTGTAFVFD